MLHRAKLLVVLCMLGVLSGCMAQMIRNDAQELMRQGEYEQALKNLEAGVARYPESPLLRAGYLSAREEAVQRLLHAAATARQRGQEAASEALLKRALALEPANERAQAALTDLERSRRVLATLEAARGHVAAGQFERALRAVESGLKDSPRDPDLRALQRQLELEARKLDAQTAVALAETRPVTLEFRDANLKMLLEALSRNTGINFIVDKDVRSEIRATVFLRQTRIEDALDLILSTNQLAKKVLDPTTVVIYPNTPDKLKEYQELMIRAFFLSSAEAKQTAALLKSMLKIKEPFVDEKLNMIVVRETPETIRLAERLIALQDQGEPEVMLDVEVLEIKTSRLTELGVKFPDNFTLTPIAPTGGLTLSNAADLNSSRIGLGVPGVTVNLKREVGDANTLANPKIRARNREKAKILIGDKLPVITTTTGGNANFVSESVSYVDVGLKVEVEPNIYLDDEVAIKVALEVSSLAGVIRTSTGSVAYQIGTRNANTVLRLRDGETQLLAGLISNEDRMSASRVPGAGDLPIVGRLFSSQRDDGQRTEIVLSITPHIVRNIRRPDLNQSEFWSGTENNLRLRPLNTRSAPSAPASPPAAAPSKPGDAVSPSGAAPAVSSSSAAVPAHGAGPGSGEALQLHWSGPQEAKVGETLRVALMVKSGVALRGLPAQFAYDPRVLQLVDIDEGSFLKQGNAAVSFTKSMQEGRATVGALRNGADGATGEGSLATLQFKVLAPGNTEVRLLAANPVATGERVEPPALPAPHAVSVRGEGR